MSNNLIDNDSYAMMVGYTKDELDSNGSQITFNSILAYGNAPDMDTLTTGGVYAVPRVSDSTKHQPPYNSGDNYWIVTVYRFKNLSAAIYQTAMSIPQNATGTASRLFVRWKATSIAMWSEWQQIGA